MEINVRNLCIAFAAGAAGGLANSLVLWLCGRVGINGVLGVALAPAFTPAWLYPRIVWGGLWGLLLFLPRLPAGTLLRGLALSLGPTLAQWLIVFPLKTEQGYFGLALGALTPLLVALFNAVWGVTAARVAARASDPLS